MLLVLFGEAIICWLNVFFDRVYMLVLICAWKLSFCIGICFWASWGQWRDDCITRRVQSNTYILSMVFFIVKAHLMWLLFLIFILSTIINYFFVSVGWRCNTASICLITKRNNLNAIVWHLRIVAQAISFISDNLVSLKTMVLRHCHYLVHFWFALINYNYL